MCDDNTLEVCEGVTMVDGEWKAVQDVPEKFTLTDHVIMAVHEVAGEKHYITKYKKKPHESHAGSYSLYYYDNNGENLGVINEHPLTDILSVVAIGKTLIANAEDGLHYYLWKSNTAMGSSYYEDLGSSIPEPQLNLYIGNPSPSVGGGVKKMHASSSVYKYVALHKNGSHISIKNCDYGYLMDAVLGSYALAKKKIAEIGGFCHPFFVRYAIEMYDGSYYKASQPILMLPAFERNVVFTVEHGSETDNAGDYYIDTTVRADVAYGLLSYELNNDYSDWGDIVKKITIFASDDVELMDLSYEFENTSSTDKTQISPESIEEYKSLLSGKYRTKTSTSYDFLKKREATDIIDDICNASVFFKISEIAPKVGYGKVNIKKNVITNLVSQPRLVSGVNGDDYYSHCLLFPTGVTAFNRRLNLFGAKRGFFEGFESFMPYTESNETTQSTHRYDIKVQIQTDEGVRIVEKGFSSEDIISAKTWFYYPDPRAKRVSINGHIYELKEHSGLNGAYYFGGFPDGSEVPLAETEDGWDVYTEPEALNSYIIQSEVDNPFCFFASGYVRVGQGDIIGLAGLTTALSQDAYKVATTLAFTTQGIWAINTDGTGQYANIQPPFSREVCNNAKSITMTDNAVFFTSEKGLMCALGANEGSVVCMSEQLRGNGEAEFLEFLKDCRIAYDYKDSLLYLFRIGEEGCWVYNIKSRMWSTIKNYFFAKGWMTSINDYPDTIVQDSDGTCYSLISKLSRDNDERFVYPVELRSRVMKFEGSLILKSIRQMRLLMQRYDLASGIEIKLYATNELFDRVAEEGTHWTELTSVRGKAWRFFKMALKGYMMPKDSLLGVAVVTQTKYTDKIR